MVISCKVNAKLSTFPIGYCCCQFFCCFFCWEQKWERIKQLLPILPRLVSKLSSFLLAEFYQALHYPILFIVISLGKIMKNSLIIVVFFAIGVMLGMLHILPKFLVENELSSYALYLLIFLVGIDVGSDSSSWKMLKSHNFKLFLIPLTTIIGTLLGAGLISFAFHSLSIKDSLAVGAGFGYYSLSSIIISQMAGKTLGVIALLANITREIFTLLFTPILEKVFGKLAPIVSGGATSMDTTLPIISRYSGKNYSLISVFHGTVLTILVPIIVTFILKFL